MVARRVVLGPLALISVDDNESCLIGDGSSRHQQINPHALLLVESTTAIVPPRIEPVVIMVFAKDVHEAPLFERREAVTFCLAHVGLSLELGRVPDITIIRSDVVVAAHNDVVARVALPIKIADQSIKPAQLVLIVIIVEGATVRDVTARHSNSATCRPRNTGISIGLSAVTEATDRIFNSDPAQDGDPVPAALTMVKGFVAHRLEGHGRKRIVGELGLLKAQDVGFESFKPSFDTSESGIQGVDIPGHNPHSGDLTE